MRKGPVESLVVENLTADQIWAELCFLNESNSSLLKKRLKRVVIKEFELIEEIDEDEDMDDDDDDDDDDEEEEDDYDEYDDEEEDEESSSEREVIGNNNDNNNNNNKVDFFSLEEMERFVNDAESKYERGDDYVDDVQELIDGAKGDEEDEEVENMKYSDFFGEGGAGVDNEADEDGFEFVDTDMKRFELADVDEKLISAFEQRAKKIERQIKEIEENQIADKHWALKGEVTQKDRPEGSLLESYVDFDQVGVTIPMLQEDHTARLEELIKKRILEGTFDDVLRRTELDVGKRKPKIQLEFAKSDKGLGEVFEDAYLQAIGEKGNKDDLTPEQKEAQKLFRKLCRSLDALTNDHYRPSAPKVKDIELTSKNVAAIKLEEVAPVGVSGSQLLAPEEIGGRRTYVNQKSDKEMDHEDRKKHRKMRKDSSKKKRQRKEEEKKARAAVDPEFAAKMKEQKEIAAIGKVKGTKVLTSDVGGGTKAGKEYTKSSKFFANLQEQVDREKQEKIDGIKPKKKKAKSEEGKTGAKFKL